MTGTRNRGIRRRLGRLLLLAGLFSAAVPPGASRANQDPEAKLESLRQQISRVKQELSRKAGERSASEQALERIEQHLGETRRQLNDLNRQATTLERELTELGSRVDALQQELEDHRALLMRQARIAYLMGRQERVKLLLGQQNPERVSRMLRYHDYLSRARQERILSIDQRARELKSLNRAMVQRRRELDTARTAKDRQQSTLELQLAERRAVLERLLAAIASDRQRLAAMTKDEEQLLALVDRLRRYLDDIPDNLGDDFAATRGKLPWPVAGDPLHRFGERRPVGNLRWNGTVLGAVAGTDVRSVFGGRVVFADWLRGFGLLMIIDHGADYMTLYGYNAALYKQVGDWVTTGEVIAQVGDSGGRREAALYFEIRSGGKPTDPGLWCRGRPRDL